MNMTQRKYLIKKVETIGERAVQKLSNQREYEHNINKSMIIKELKNWRPLTKKESYTRFYK